MVKKALPRLYLGHGASGNASSMRPWVQALAKVGITAEAVDLPRGNQARAIDIYRQCLAGNPDAAIGGHSFGGRMASLLAAEANISALVLLSYPLHRPGHPEDLRSSHWAKISCPVLLLSGESDPFAKLPLLRREVKKLKHGKLITYPSQGHGLLPIVADVAPRVAAFLS